MNNERKHIVRSFSDELAVLDRQILRMGGLAEQLLGDSFDALVLSDRELALDVIRRDRLIDDIEKEVEERVIAMIARRQPMAIDLRRLLSALKISNELERVGDLSKNIAKRAHAIAGEEIDPSIVAGLRNMTGAALAQLHNVMDAYADRNAAVAHGVWVDDELLDATYNSVFAELISLMVENADRVVLYTHLMFGAKNLERVGDHTTNIAETVHFLVRGEPMHGERPKQNSLVDNELVLDPLDAWTP